MKNYDLASDQFANNLKLFMELKNTNIKELAKKSNLSEKTISKSLDKRHNLTLRTACIIADALEIDYDFLFTKISIVPTSKNKVLVSNIFQGIP